MEKVAVKIRAANSAPFFRVLLVETSIYLTKTLIDFVDASVFDSLPPHCSSAGGIGEWQNRTTQTEAQQQCEPNVNDMKSIPKLLRMHFQQAACVLLKFR